MHDWETSEIVTYAAAIALQDKLGVPVLLGVPKHTGSLPQNPWWDDVADGNMHANFETWQEIPMKHEGEPRANASLVAHGKERRDRRARLALPDSHYL